MFAETNQTWRVQRIPAIRTLAVLMRSVDFRCDDFVGTLVSALRSQDAKIASDCISRVDAAWHLSRLHDVSYPDVERALCILRAAVRGGEFGFMSHEICSALAEVTYHDEFTMIFWRM